MMNVNFGIKQATYCGFILIFVIFLCRRSNKANIRDLCRRNSQTIKHAIIHVLLSGISKSFNENLRLEYQMSIKH